MMNDLARAMRRWTEKINAIVSHSWYDVATALIRGICKMQLAVRIDKRPGESHMALDGKKRLLVTLGNLDWKLYVSFWF